MPSVTITSFDDRLPPLNGSAIVTVDVLRATTTAITARAAGRRCLPVPTLEAALDVAARTPGSLLAGELGGNRPYGFDLTNSPAELAARADVERPLVLLSTSGTRLLCAAAEAAEDVYVAALRNHSAVAEAAAARGRSVVIAGAETRGEFREEDKLCCARIARALLEAGYDAGDTGTSELVRVWSQEPVERIAESKSAKYLRDTDQVRDLEFVLGHVDDVRRAYRVADGEIVEEPL